MATVRWNPQFIGGFEGGRRYVLEVEPPLGVAPRGTVLCIQPLGEEANLSRRVLVVMAGRLASLGWTVNIIDLHGMGDSDGESHETSAGIWRTDLVEFAERAMSASVSAHRTSVIGQQERRLVIWGVRLGCLLAVDLLAYRGSAADALLLWQPGELGKGAIGLPEQLKHPSVVATESADRRDGFVMLNGYRYRKDLLDDIVAFSTEPPDRRTRDVSLIHLARHCPADRPVARSFEGTHVSTPTRAGEEPRRESKSQASVRQLAQRWQQAGSRVDLSLVQGEPFWSSIEPAMPVEALDATEAFLASL